MEAMESQAKPFRFSEPRQERIHHRLFLVGPGPATFYRDACRLVEDGDLESASHLVAHLLREIESAIRDVLEPVVGVRRHSEIESRVSQKTEIRAILGYLRIPESDVVARAWLSLASRKSKYALHALAHRRELLQPRPLDKEFEDFWIKSQRVLDVVLEKFEARYASVFDYLDKLASKTAPSLKDVKELQNHVPNNLATLGYFFDKLAHASWLSPLQKRGFFNHPPGPLRNEQGEIVNFPLWPASRYLARIGVQDPRAVIQIILSIPETRNIRVHEDLADMALAIPPSDAVQWALKETKWIEKQSHFDLLLPQKLGALVAHLAKGGQIEASLKIARALLSPLPASKSASRRKKKLPPTEPTFRIDAWNYSEILKDNVPELVAAAGLDALSLLCDLLDSAIGPRHPPDDLSHVWRPAIEIDEQFSSREPRELLVSVVRDAAEAIAGSDLGKVRIIVAALEKRHRLVFRRIAIHLVRVHPDGVQDLIANYLTDRKRFDDVGLWHEYATLLKSHFGGLSLDNQGRILQWIDEGPPHDETSTGARRSREELEAYAKHWRLRRFAMIPDALRGKWADRYSALVSELGKPDHPEFLFYTETGFGPTSPLSAQQLKAKSIPEAIGYLKAWQAPGGFLHPSPEGLARELAAAVSSDPDKFAQKAQEFRGVDPTYVRGLLSGLQGAARQKTPFSWRPVIELSRWVIDQPREITGLFKRADDSDPDWTWTRKAIAGLFSAGFEKGPAEIPYDLRESAWAVIRPLTEDPDPSLDDEVSNYDPQNMDPSTLSINTVRGEALHAVVRYALWVRRHLGEETSGDERIVSGFKEMPEVREVLDAHLEIEREKSLAIHSIYGKLFPWLLHLDRGWTASRMGKIFPADEAYRDFRQVAWETHVVFCPPYEDTFRILLEEYMHAVGRIDEPPKWRHLQDPNERLAEHVMTLYWQGRIDLNHPLVDRFYEKASGQLRQHSIRFIGRSLMNTEQDIAPSIIARLRTLWEHRLNDAMSHPEQRPLSELTGFGWWFACGKFDGEWAIAQLLEVVESTDSIDADHLVLERLSDQASLRPKQVMRALNTMLSREDHLMAIAWREDITAILRGVLSGDDDEAREDGISLVNRLVARGHLEYRHLLDFRLKRNPK